MKLEAVWPFYAGILVQAVFLLIGQFERSDLTKLLGCCAGSLLGFIPGKHEHQYSLSFHLFAAAAAFSIIYAIFFKQKILERINKEILMVWTMVGLYIAFQTSLITAHPPVLIVLSALSAIPIVNAFAHFDKSYGWKVYLYIWFLCVLIGIAASKFAFSTVVNIFQFHQNAEEINSVTAFFVGMSFLYLTVNLWYVIELIPLPGKHQSFSERLEHVKEDMEILADDYDDAQVRWWKTVLLLAISISLLALNYFQHFVSDETLIPLLIVLLPVTDKFKLPCKAPVQTIANTDPPIEAGEKSDA
jgi:hypothetical protein